MVDFDLARKVLNKIQKDNIELMKSLGAVTEALEKLLQRIIGELDLMYDVLHLDELSIINPNRDHDITKN